jgi:heat shock protein HslJ
VKTKLFLGILVCTVLISCKTNKNVTNENIHRNWLLVQFEDFPKEKLMDKNCYLDLRDKENAAAKMGCNSLGFSYYLNNGNAISFKQGSATRMFCDDNTIETKFLEVITTSSSYKIEGQKLYLTTKSDKELIFIAEDWD